MNGDQITEDNKEIRGQDSNLPYDSGGGEQPPLAHADAAVDGTDAGQQVDENSPEDKADAPDT